jgi:predicted small secreted protein
MLKRLLFAIALLGITSTFFGCHTARGFGRDVEDTGRNIQEHTPP